jgi:hypothetical protein
MFRDSRQIAERPADLREPSNTHRRSSDDDWLVTAHHWRSVTAMPVTSFS